MSDDDKKITDLARSARGGDETALSELIDLVQPRLFRFCFYLTASRELAEDICQDSLIKVLTKIRSLKKPEQFLSWIFRSAKNRFLDHIKSHKVSKTETIENKGDFHKESDSAMAETLSSLSEALSALSDEDRYLILLVDQQGYSYKEAADIIGVSESAVTSRIYRIRQDFLKKYG